MQVGPAYGHAYLMCEDGTRKDVSQSKKSIGAVRKQKACVSTLNEQVSDTAFIRKLKSHPRIVSRSSVAMCWYTCKSLLNTLGEALQNSWLCALPSKQVSS